MCVRGYSVLKRVPTAVQPLESRGCRDPGRQKKAKNSGDVLVLYGRIGELYIV